MGCITGIIRAAERGVEKAGRDPIAVVSGLDPDPTFKYSDQRRSSSNEHGPAPQDRTVADGEILHGRKRGLTG